jgi:excisionase family DNA binding protein
MTTAAKRETTDARREQSPAPSRVIDLTTATTTTGSLTERVNGERPVLSVAEAAELLGVSEWLVLQQISRGELPHKRCGRRIVLSRERLLAWLNEG